MNPGTPQNILESSCSWIHRPPGSFLRKNRAIRVPICIQKLRFVWQQFEGSLVSAGFYQGHHLHWRFQHVSCGFLMLSSGCLMLHPGMLRCQGFKQPNARRKDQYVEEAGWVPLPINYCTIYLLHVWYIHPHLGHLWCKWWWHVDKYSIHITHHMDTIFHSPEISSLLGIVTLTFTMNFRWHEAPWTVLAGSSSKSVEFWRST